MKLILRLLKPEIEKYKSQIIIAFLIALPLSLTASGISKIMKVAVDDVLSLKSSPSVMLYLPVIYFVRGATRYFLNINMRQTAEGMTALVRKRALEKLLSLNLSFHTTSETGTGGLMSRVLNDIGNLREGLLLLFNLFIEPFVAIVILVTMFINDWRLTLICLAVSPIFIYVMRKTSKSLKKYGHRNQNQMEKLTSTVKESLDGIRVIQSFNLEEEQNRRFYEQTKVYIEQQNKIISRETLASPINEFVAALLVAGLFIFQTYSISQANSTTGTFFSFLFLAGLLQEPIKKIQDSIVRLQQTIVTCERLEDLLNSKQVVEEVEDPLPFPTDWKTIEFKKIRFSYGNETILRDIDLTVNRGQQIALVGSSGSGKSTFVNLLPRFFDPQEGQILIDGVDLKQFSLKDLRKNIALVTQDVFLFNDSVESNIAAGDLTKDRALVKGASQKAHAEQFINIQPKGYDTSVGDRGGRFSGGEKQRISIARAIFKDAPLLILDEATSALDTVSELEVQKGLQSLMENRTSFVIAHRLSTVRQADRILVMKQGEIVEQGKHSELLDLKGEYYHFYQTQLSHNEPKF